MDIFPTAEQDELIGSARAMLRRELPVVAERWPANAPSPTDRRAIAIFADLGWYALGLAEDRGGVGFGPAEEALLLVEAGRHVAPLGLLAGMLGVRLAAETGEDALARAIVAGQASVAFAMAGATPRLIAATDAEYLLLFDGGGAALYPAAVFQDRALLPSLDETVTIERAAGPFGEPCARIDDAAILILHRDMLAAAYCAGLAEQLMALGVEQACTREQFGQLIGAFQAIKHPCADMAMRSEGAHWQVMLAALAIANGVDDAAYQIHAAAVLALDAAFANGATTVQIFGGMGFTAECPVHFFIKRAHVIDRLVGGRAAQIGAVLAAEAPEMIRRPADEENR